MTREALVEIFGADYPDVKTRNVIITRVLAALEKEREGEVLIAMGPLDIEAYATDKGGYLPDIHIDEGDKIAIDGKKGQLIFRPTKAEKGGGVR